MFSILCLHSRLNTFFYTYILVQFTFMLHVFILHSQSQRTNSIGFFGCKQRSKNFTLWTCSIWIANLCARTSIFKFGLGHNGTHVLTSIFNRRSVQLLYIICMINGFWLWYWKLMTKNIFFFNMCLENKTLRTLTERNFMFQTVSNATFSVDTFFFIR